MEQQSSILYQRKTYSQVRLAEFRKRVSVIPELRALQHLCIYATGSYARLEASKFSDLDLFFVVGTTGSAVPRIDKTLLDADLIRICRNMEFPDFSGDGEYLQIHNLVDIQKVLGSPEDDFRNFFTARLLLLLESQPILNDPIYAEAIKTVISWYFRDYHDHEASFRPLFLVNDILRFWKTLCLNYEHRRNRPPENELERNKSHLKNLKLKFSRMLTCYSMVIPLSVNPGGITPEQVYALSQQPPFQRLVMLTEGHPEINGNLSHLREDYSWFLKTTGQTPNDLLRWIGDRTNRDDAFDRARKFGAQIYDLLRKVSTEDNLRYLVI